MKFYPITLLVLGIVFGHAKYTQAGSESHFGEMCTGPDGNTNSCDHASTFLYCYEGRCKCPDSHLMTSANLPINLNAKWSKDAKKCLAIKGSSCGIQPGGNKMECQAEFKCNFGDNAKIGTCGSSHLQMSIFSFVILVCSVFKSYY